MKPRRGLPAGVHVAGDAAGDAAPGPPPLRDWREIGELAKDRGRMLDLLRPTFPSPLEVVDCELDSIRRVAAPEDDATAGLLACYRISLRDRNTGASARQLYSAHVSAAAADLHARFLSAPLAPAALGPSALHLPAASMVLLAFPNDPLLPQLPECLTREAVEECLRSAPDLPPAEILDVAWSVLKYDPGRRCTLRFTVRTTSAGEERAHALIAKTHQGRRTARAFDTMTRLWALWPARPSSPWVLARPLCYDAGRRLSWQEALPGRPFWSLYPDLDVTAAFRRMAGVAADLHQRGFARKPRPDALLDDGGPGLLAATYPELGERCARILRGLEAARPEAPANGLVSLHGDFHPDQFLIDRDRIGLTDFDRAHLGDPAFDLGRFASHVLLNALQRELDPDRFEDPLDQFLEAYAARAPEWKGTGTFHWHVAVQLATRRVHKFLDHVVDDPEAKIERMLGLAERYLERVG